MPPAPDPAPGSATGSSSDAAPPPTGPATPPPKPPASSAPPPPGSGPPPPPKPPPGSPPPGSPPPGSPPPGSPPPPPGPEPAPGLGEQVSATREAARRLVEAHVELAKAEFAEIGDSAKRASIYVGIAVGTAILAALLLGVGLPLFLGEWIFGSIGWGILLGLLLLVAAALAGTLLALEPAINAHVGRAFAFGVFIGIVVAIIFGGNLTNAAWAVLADNVAGNLAADSRPLVVALISLSAIGAVIGLVVGLANGLGTRAIGTLVLGALAGFGLGYLTAAAPGPRVGIAIAIAVGLAVWIAYMVRALAGAEWDTEGFKARYTPTRTIQATKETIEWARERMPLSKRS